MLHVCSYVQTRYEIKFKNILRSFSPKIWNYWLYGVSVCSFFHICCVKIILYVISSDKMSNQIYFLRIWNNRLTPHKLVRFGCRIFSKNIFFRAHWTKYIRILVRNEAYGKTYIHLKNSRRSNALHSLKNKNKKDQIKYFAVLLLHDIRHHYRRQIYILLRIHYIYL